MLGCTEEVSTSVTFAAKPLSYPPRFLNLVTAVTADIDSKPEPASQTQCKQTEQTPQKARQTHIRSSVENSRVRGTKSSILSSSSSLLIYQ